MQSYDFNQDVSMSHSNFGFGDVRSTQGRTFVAHASHIGILKAVVSRGAALLLEFRH